MTINASHIEFQKETNILTYLRIEEKKYGTGPHIMCWNIPLYCDKHQCCLYSLVDGKYFGREYRVFCWSPPFSTSLFKKNNLKITGNTQYLLPEDLFNSENLLFLRHKISKKFIHTIECVIKELVSEHQLRIYQ